VAKRDDDVFIVRCKNAGCKKTAGSIQQGQEAEKNNRRED